jgi:hypothetical protein
MTLALAAAAKNLKSAAGLSIDFLPCLLSPYGREYKHLAKPQVELSVWSEGADCTTNKASYSIV